MIDIDEIRKRMTEGKRKWSKPLLQFIQQKLNDGYTYEYVSEWLSKQHLIEISPKKLMDLKSKHKKYEQKRKKNQLLPVTPTNLSRQTIGSSAGYDPSPNEHYLDSNDVQPTAKDYRRKPPEPRKLR